MNKGELESEVKRGEGWGEGERRGKEEEREAGKEGREEGGGRREGRRGLKLPSLVRKYARRCGCCNASAAAAETAAAEGAREGDGERPCAASEGEGHGR